MIPSTKPYDHGSGGSAHRIVYSNLVPRGETFFIVAADMLDVDQFHTTDGLMIIEGFIEVTG
jgi:hypothetical protein